MQRSDLNALVEKDRSKRKGALERILKSVSPTSEGTLPSAIPREEYHAVLRSVLKCFEDSVERCRELSIAIVSQFVTPRKEGSEEKVVGLPSAVDEEALDWILPVLVARIGQADVVEPSEELRLRLLLLAVDVLAAFPHDVGRQGYADFYVAMFIAGVKDAFPELKKTACRGIMALCAAVESVRLKSHVVPLAKAVKLHGMLHKHSAVRVDALHAFTTLLRCGAVEILGDMKDESQENRTTMHYLYVTSTDHAEPVRIAFLELAAACVLDIRDRLEQHKRFFPLLMVCCIDPLSTAVRAKAREIMVDVGKLYIMDNEDNRVDLSRRRITAKDIEMYADDDDLYPIAIIRENLQDPCVVRPTLGTRLVVADAIRNFIDTFLIPYMTSGVDPVKCKHGVRCLVMTILYTESYVLEYLQKIVDAMYKVLADIREGTPEFEEVIPNIRVACQLLGHFLPPDHFVAILVPTNFQTLPLRHHVSVFTVMREVLRGSSVGKYKLSIEHAKNITRAVTNEVVVSSAVSSGVPETVIKFVQLLDTVIEVLQHQSGILVILPPEVVNNPQIQTLDFALFWALLQVLESAHVNPVHTMVRESIAKLSIIVSGTPTGIYSAHTARCFIQKGAQLPSFILSELQKYVEASCLDHFVQLYLHALHDVKFTVNITNQLHYFTLLQELCSNAEIVSRLSADHVRNLLRAVILEQCRFRPGGSALLFRRVATTCLSHLLRNNVIGSKLTNHSDDVNLMERIVDAFSHTLDADEAEMRLGAAVVIHAVWNLTILWSAPNSTTHGQNVVNSIFSRLDDGNDVIRRTTLLELAKCYTSVAADPWDRASCLTHYCASPEILTGHAKTVILHMDDMNSDIREMALEVLKAMKRVNREVIMRIAGEARAKHTFVSHVDQLLDA
jgi:dynein assembly factor 5